MAVTALSSSGVIPRLLKMREQMDTLQAQFASQMKSDTYGGLGRDRTLSVNFRQQIAAVDAYSSNIDMVSLRIKLMDTALTRLGEIPSEVKGAADPNAFEVRLDGKTDAQKTAQIALDEVTGLLNSEANGRYLFAGNASEAKPVATSATILEGGGGKAGFNSFVDQRRRADLGADGLGRLAVSSSGSTVTVGKAVPVSAEFGFKVTGVNSTLSNTTASVAGDPAQLAVNFTGVPEAGQTIQVSLGNPDGTTSTLTLTASHGPEIASDEFLIGADGAATAANLQTQLSAAIATKAQTDLRAASAMAAADDFFDTAGGRLPQAVDTSGGVPPEEAVGLTDADPATTVIWYSGQNDPIDPADSSTRPRNDVSARIDSSIDVAYGARANEEGFTTVVKALAVLSVESFSTSVATDEKRYAALTERTRAALSFPNGAASPEDIHAEIAVAGRAAEQAATRHIATKCAMQEIVEGVEGIDIEEVAAQMLRLQTLMQASYQTTSMLSQLSLTNYL